MLKISPARSYSHRQPETAADAKSRQSRLDPAALCNLKIFSPARHP
ncbi:MAG: hypothetical protein MUC60_14305 [Oscillatoria sp. Prado101]|nr:hypothetical protein [Oscillatoria sp. Prado101]